MKELKELENEQYRYYITECGKVYVERKSDGRLKEKPLRLKKGYPTFKVRSKGKYTQYSVHRLVAETFIPNLEKKPQVNHIDGNKENPHVTNLEWVTPKENIRHAIDTLKVNKRVNTYIICKIRKEVIDVTETYMEALDKYGTWVIDSYRGRNSYGNLIAVPEEEYFSESPIDEMIKKRETKKLHNTRTKYRRYNQNFVDELKMKFESTKLVFSEFCKQVGLDHRTVKIMLNDEYFKDSKHHQRRRQTARCFYSGVLAINCNRYGVK